MHYFTALGAVCLGAASRIFKSKIKETTAAVVVGVGLLVGSTADVQAACDPPVFDVCLHKAGGGWSSSGHATLFVEFNGKLNQLYEFEWNGLKKLPNRRGILELTYDSVSQEGRSGYYASLSYSSFWWEPWSPWNNYGVTIYEGHFDWSNGSGAEWVRDRWVAQVDFFSTGGAFLVDWIFTLINRRRTFLSTIALPFSIMNCPLITARWIGNLNQLRCCMDIAKAIGKGLFAVVIIIITVTLALLVFIIGNLVR